MKRNPIWVKYITMYMCYVSNSHFSCVQVLLHKWYLVCVNLGLEIMFRNRLAWAMRKSQLIGHCKPWLIIQWKYEYFCCLLITIDLLTWYTWLFHKMIKVLRVKSQNTKFVNIQCFSGKYHQISNCWWFLFTGKTVKVHELYDY